jgi:hypothetical protein
MAIEIAGPLRVEPTQITQDVRNDFANRTDDLDDFPAPRNVTQAGDTPLSTPAGDRPSTQPGGKKRPNPDATPAANDAGSKRRKTKVCLLNVSNITAGTKYLTRSTLLEPKAPKPSPSLAFRSKGGPDTIVALSEVKTWDDKFLSRCEITKDEIVYMGWDGLGEEKPCCTDREPWDSRLEEYHRDGHTGLFVRRQTSNRMPSMRVSKMFSFVRVTFANIFSKVVCFLRSFILVARFVFQKFSQGC